MKLHTGQARILRETNSFTIRREAKGRYVEGVFYPGAETSIPGKGSVQPISGKERLSLPEGDRDKDHRELFTAQCIKMNDTVDFDGQVFVIYRVEPWGPHYEARMVEVDTEVRRI